MARVSGAVSVSVRVRGAEGGTVPRVQVEAVVGGVHCLLAPAQLHILTEIAANLGGGRSEEEGRGGVGTNTGHHSPGILHRRHIHCLYMYVHAILGHAATYCS